MNKCYAYEVVIEARHIQNRFVDIWNKKIAKAKAGNIKNKSNGKTV